MMDETGAGKLLLANGRAPAKKSGDLVTRKEVETFVEQYTNARVTEIVEFYMRQFPDLVAAMLAKAFEANGMTLQGPPKAEGTAEGAT